MARTKNTSKAPHTSPGVTKAKAKVIKVVKPKKAKLVTEIPGDEFDSSGRPITLVGPPAPAGYRVVPIPGMRGGLMFYCLNTKQMFFREGMNPSADPPVPKFQCVTVKIRPKDEQFTDKRCKGRLLPHVEHDVHDDCVEPKILRRWINNFAIRNFCVLSKKYLPVHQFRVAEKYYGELILLKAPDPAIKFPTTMKNLVDHGSPFELEFKRFKNGEHINLHPIEDYYALWECNYLHIHDRYGPVLDRMVPKIDFGYEGLKDKRLPAQDELYIRRMEPPGRFSVFLLKVFVVMFANCASFCYLFQLRSRL